LLFKPLLARLARSERLSRSRYIPERTTNMKVFKQTLAGLVTPVVIAGVGSLDA
jgi:hypothetical protein